ncbi:JAB domain-containing protein [Desulfosporosinus lacus]|uniref:DNA repair protein RadC n=1 Tax=Desulfosporosinus lacus DSM 15449 TaxID=1121420 RepID=A0A1M5V058_9FIRM|nr:JAB domain-containing protein [Desulfosporosinus lacus]SHH68609.1 DNA repair protein RadC [Desulfosporosinus lacus DSM 15449]
MKRNYDKEYASSFIKGLSRLTGISESKLKKYALENNLFNVLEHPRTIDPNKQQLEKIYILNEFISVYRLLKLQEHTSKLSFTSSKVAGDYFTALLGGIKDREKFMAAFLDNGHNIIEVRTFSEGSIAEAVVYPRAILQAALDCDCRAILLAHNHPGGSMSPSIQDRDITQRLISIFTPLQISVLDHIIVAGTTYHSMMEHGTLPQTSSDICYNAIFLDDRKAAEENETDFRVDISNYSKSYLSNCCFPESEDQTDEDEWEL